MDFTITEEQKQFRQEVIQFAKDNLNDEDGMEQFSYKMWKKAADFGLFGINVEEEYGGLGESYVMAALLTEALGYGCRNNGFIFAVNNHIWVALNMIHLYGSKELKDTYLADMVNGTKIGAFALTEAEAGSDAYNMSAKALDNEDYYILDGNKIFISNGTIADVFLVAARTKTDPVKKFTVFVVEKEFGGVSVSKDIKKLGLEACPTAELILKGCRVPKKNILGHIDGGSNIVNLVLEWERCFEAAPHVGAIQRIMESCIEYANSRIQFNHPIIENQAISHKIADMKVCGEMSRLMLYKIAWMKDNKKNAFLESSIFKLYVSESYVKVCQNAMQIFGAYGYTKEYPIEQEIRDALASTIYSGTSEIQRNTISSIASSEILYQ